MPTRQPSRTTKLQPAGLPLRVVDGRVLYSHVVVVEAGRQLFISGQLARDAQGAIVGKGDMRAQIRQVGENLKTALAAAGASLDALVKTTTYVTDIDEYFKHVDLRMDYFGPGMPTSTTVEVRRLSHPDFMIEVEAVALLDDAPGSAG
jgi:2-iminobutanoate/2-iminopropanoate deaminase